MNLKTGLFLFFIVLISACTQDTKFDSDTWKNAGGENITLDTRLNMTNDLLDKKILINKNEAEIIKLIGSPSILHQKEVDSIQYFAVQEIYGYDLDPEKMLFLKITFNKNGRSTSIERYSTK